MSVAGREQADTWYVYLLECRRGTYVGITNDLVRRYRAHCTGKGARYTRANPPLALLGAQPFAGRAEASRAEYALKQRPAAQKRRWAEQWPWQRVVDARAAGLDFARRAATLEDKGASIER